MYTRVILYRTEVYLRAHNYSHADNRPSVPQVIMPHQTTSESYAQPWAQYLLCKLEYNSYLGLLATKQMLILVFQVQTAGPASC